MNRSRDAKPRSSPVGLFIVEDHEVMRREYSMLLDLYEDLYVCGTAADGTSALSGIPEATPDVVVIDISLPGMDGIELVRRITEAWPDLPCIVATGYSDASHIERALQAGARGFMDKAELVDQIENAVDAILNGDLFVAGAVRPGTSKEA